jgi:hypothetical protein
VVVVQGEVSGACPQHAQQRGHHHGAAQQEDADNRAGPDTQGAQVVGDAVGGRVNLWKDAWSHEHADGWSGEGIGIHAFMDGSQQPVTKTSEQTGTYAWTAHRRPPACSPRLPSSASFALTSP